MVKKAQKTQHNPYVFVIAGQDPALVSEQLEKLIKDLVPEDQRETTIASYENPPEIAELLDELRTLPFLTDKRVVIVRNARKFISEYRPQLENYFDNPSNTGILILVTDTWPGNTKLAKKLPKVGQLISANPPDRKQLPGVLANYAKSNYNKKINRATISLLIEFVGEKPARLYSEIDKLATYVDEKTSIDTTDVENLIGRNRLFNVFEVIDLILDGDSARAIDKLRLMFQEDKSAEYKVTGAFAYHFRKLFNVKTELSKGKNPKQLIHPYKIYGNTNGFFYQVRRMSLTQIGDIISSLAETDFAIKTGRSDTKVAIERLVFQQANKPAGATR